MYNNIFIVFQGCSEYAEFFLGGLCHSLNDEVGGYPVGGGRCLRFCHKFVTLDPKQRQLLTIMPNI